MADDTIAGAALNRTLSFERLKYSAAKQQAGFRVLCPGPCPASVQPSRYSQLLNPNTVLMSLLSARNGCQN